MAVTYRAIIGQLNKLHLLHRIYIQRAAARNQTCFGQMPLLEFVMEHESCTQKEIADHLQISSPAVAGSVKRLERDGMVERVADPNDLRCNRLTITEEGKCYVKTLQNSFDGVDALAFRGFKEEECEALFDYLQRLTANLETDEFRERTVASLINEEKQLHMAMKQKEKEEDRRG